MSRIKLLYELLYRNSYFLFFYFVLLFLLLIFTVIIGNEKLFLLLNQYHNSVNDSLFIFFTLLGNGIFAFLFMAVLLFVSLRDAANFFVITILITILVYILKNYFFSEFDRPVSRFGELVPIYTADHYAPPLRKTFPSGHSATIFSLVFYISMMVRQKWLKVALLIIAALVAYSRVYLAAHFPADILAGSFIGVFITIGSVIFIKPRLTFIKKQRLSFNGLLSRSPIFRSRSLRSSPHP